MKYLMCSGLDTECAMSFCKSSYVCWHDRLRIKIVRIVPATIAAIDIIVMLNSSALVINPPLAI